MYLKSTDIPGTVDDPETGEKVQKSVFIVFFAGERAKSKIVKICDAFSANKYPFPEDISKQSQMNGEVATLNSDSINRVLFLDILHDFSDLAASKTCTGVNQATRTPNNNKCLRIAPRIHATVDRRKARHMGCPRSTRKGCLLSDEHAEQGRNPPRSSG